jgi:hypothetical protein
LSWINESNRLDTRLVEQCRVKSKVDASGRQERITEIRLVDQWIECQERHLTSL